MKNILADYLCNLKPKDVIIIPGKNGRICLKDDRNLKRKIDFNLSHSNGMIAFTVGDSCSVGIDIENINTIKKRNVRYHFNSNEKEWIEKEFFIDKDVAYCALWSIKEAFGKAIGCGILPVLQKPHFYINNNKITFDKQNSIRENPEIWSFRLFLLPGKCIMALAIEGTYQVDKVKLFQIKSISPIRYVEKHSELNQESPLICCVA